MAVRFEITLNGKRLCLAGHAGYGVLSAVLTWCLRNPDRLRRAQSTMTAEQLAAEELHFQIGGLDTNDPGEPRDIGWLDRIGPLPMQPGDEITIRILGPGAYDPPLGAHHGP